MGAAGFLSLRAQKIHGLVPPKFGLPPFLEEVWFFVSFLLIFTLLVPFLKPFRYACDQLWKFAMNGALLEPFIPGQMAAISVFVSCNCGSPTLCLFVSCPQVGTPLANSACLMCQTLLLSLFGRPYGPPSSVGLSLNPPAPWDH